MTVPDADGETFTMRYPAGMPVKVNLNGKHVSLGGERRSVESAGMEAQSVAYRYVQQRQQQVHAQLQYGARGEYYRPRRTTLSGGAGM
jgi:phage-related protein